MNTILCNGIKRIISLPFSAYNVITETEVVCEMYVQWMLGFLFSSSDNMAVFLLTWIWLKLLNIFKNISTLQIDCC